MNKFLNFRARVASLKLLVGVVMSKNNEKVYYAVGRGRVTGIYDTWKECKTQTEGIANAKYRKFFSLEEAEEFVNFWKNYSSPVKESDESQNSVSTNRERIAVNGPGNCQGASKKISNKSRSSAFISKNMKNFVLGHEKDEENSNSKVKVCLTPYISPIPPLLDPEIIRSYRTNRDNSVQIDSMKDRNEFKQRKKKFNDNSTKTFNHSYSAEKVHRNKRTKVQNERLSLDSSKFSQKSPRSSNSCPDSLNSSFEYSQVFNNGAPFVTSTQNYPSEGDPVGEEKINDCGVNVSGNMSSIVKEEVIDVDTIPCERQTQSENFQNGGKALNINDKVVKSLKMLESALTVISKLSSDESETFKSSLKTLLERIFTNTNASVNLQMGSPNNLDKICEDSKNCDKGPIGDVQASPAQEVSKPSYQQHSMPQMHQAHFQLSSPHSASFEGRTEPRNVDVLALNLRLDSFEKRFDACLKEVGAIVSDISHIKSEIKEIREKLNSDLSNSGSGVSPRKGKDGMLQTTLSFGSGGENKALHKSYSTYQDEADPNRFNTKRGKNLKRKLSRSDSSDNSKRFANDEEDHNDLLNRIKTEAVDYTSFTLDEDDYVEVYTDGASHSNGKTDAKAGIGIWWGENHPLNVAEPVVGPPTNNTAEIQAARVAMELAVKSGIKKLKIFTDSEFLINCATRWIHRWKKNGWLLVNGGPVKNRKELEKLDKVAGKVSVRWEKVAGHAGIRGNEMADRLANEGAAKYKG